MSATQYELACNAIRLMPLVIMLFTWVAISAAYPLKYSWLWVFVLGYVSGLVSVYWYWDFAIAYAPTEEIASAIAQKDGAPQVFAPFVMPLYVAIAMLLLFPIVYLINWTGFAFGLFTQKKGSDIA